MKIIVFNLLCILQLAVLPAQTITVHPETSYQTVKHWEGVDVDEASTHRYGGPSDMQLDQNQAIDEADGKRLSQLEFIGATYHMLHDDLKRNHIAWAQYVLDSYYHVDPQGAYYGIIQTDPQNPQVNVSSLAKSFRHYMPYFRPSLLGWIF